MKTSIFEFRWSDSGLTCSLYINGQRVASCIGGGYDKKGTCLGNWLEKCYPEQVNALPYYDFYGASLYNGKVYLDGAYGFESMQPIVAAIHGNKLQYCYETKNSIFYTLTKTMTSV